MILLGLINKKVDNILNVPPSFYSQNTYIKLSNFLREEIRMVDLM